MLNNEDNGHYDNNTVWFNSPVSFTLIPCCCTVRTYSASVPFYCSMHKLHCID